MKKNLVVISMLFLGITAFVDVKQNNSYHSSDYRDTFTGRYACTTSLPICTPSDYYLRKVQKDITVGGVGCTPNFNPSTSGASYTLRATDFVLLDEGTIIDPTGTGYFAIDIISCPQ